jgi:hypothetical protein
LQGTTGASNAPTPTPNTANVRVAMRNRMPDVGRGPSPATRGCRAART